MIILDTNILSEAVRATPHPSVEQWWRAQPARMLFTTSVSRAELFYGAYLLPDGKRKELILKAISEVIQWGLNGQVLSFDSDAADAYAKISSSRRASGRPIGQLDAMIAAIASSRGARLATRNTKDFIECGVALINPWES